MWIISQVDGSLSHKSISTILWTRRQNITSINIIDSPIVSLRNLFACKPLRLYSETRLKGSRHYFISSYEKFRKIESWIVRYQHKLWFPSQVLREVLIRSLYGPIPTQRYWDGFKGRQTSYLRIYHLPV